MSAKRKTTVAVIFGGRSVEHDVSIVTGHQIMRAFDAERYIVVPVYIGRDGRWFTGDPLRDLDLYKDGNVSGIKGVEETLISPSVQHHGLILNPLAGRFSRSEVRRVDVVFPAVHGSHGEDGTLQGLLELADIPYVGCGVMSSAVANDKLITKDVLRQNNIPVIDSEKVYRQEWLNDRAAVLARLQAALAFPMFVKPATLGSSIGVARVADEPALVAALDVAVNFDQRVSVEAAVVGAVEINCAVMGNTPDIQPSVLEQPISWEEFLTFEEKYTRGDEGMKSAERIIPAPLDDELTARIQQTAIDAFQAIEGRGIARIDFLLDADGSQFYLNEINTMPGSLAFYLWAETDMSNADVVDGLVRLAQEAHAEKRRNTYDYQTSLVALTTQRGLKGVKGKQATRAN